jgi:hypothetical protein
MSDDMYAPDEIERPLSCPERGLVPAFDAGWDAQRLGIERETVLVLTQGRDAWALMGYDIRDKLVADAANRPPHTNGYSEYENMDEMLRAKLGKRSDNGLLIGEHPRREGATEALHD